MNKTRNTLLIVGLIIFLIALPLCAIATGVLKVDLNILVNQTECYFAGGRQTDGTVPGHATIEYAGTCDPEALENGVSLQPYWEEVVSNNTRFPAGITVDSVKPLKLELLNDGVQVLAIGKSAEDLKFYVLTRDDSEVPFWSASCIYRDAETGDLTVYMHDVGGPGGFDGACSGNTETLKGYPSSRIGNPELYRYIEAIYFLADQGYTLPEKPLRVDVIWFKE